jgi:hypothetical protein
METNIFKDFLAGGGEWGSLMGSSALQQFPQAAYYSSPAGQKFGAASPRRGRYFQQAYGDVYNQYLGEIGSAWASGNAPTTFQEFLKNDPWTKRYGQLPQYERGVTKTYTDPRTRFIFY